MINLWSIFDKFMDINVQKIISVQSASFVFKKYALHAFPVGQILKL